LAIAGYFIANSIFCILDAKRLNSDGHQSPNLAWLLLIPVYLWQRASLLKQAPHHFWVWIVAFILSVLLSFVSFQPGFWNSSKTNDVKMNALNDLLFENETIKIVKGGTLSICPSHSVEKMVNSFMGAPSWKSGTSSDGRDFVNVEGDITFHNKPVRAMIQFFVQKDKGFSFNAFEMNGVPSDLMTAMGLLELMCESATAQAALYK